jgi:probable rRNA maturation factor
MIKVNVKINNRSWRKEIKNPKKYFSEKLKKINLQISKLVKQQHGYFFKTTKRRKNKITFNILLTNSLNMKRLNKKFLRKCKSTDVLSFPDYMPNSKFSTNLYEQVDLLTEKSEGIFLGEIAIDYEIINSRRKGNNFLLEFDKAWIHGLLHLLGFDHKKNKDYFKMKKKEDLIIKHFHKKN